MQLTRRGLLIGAAAGGGLIAAWNLGSRHYSAPLSAGSGETAFDAWIKIARDGMVTVAVPQLEMGQGITTLLPQIAAVELGADWRQVAVEPAPVSGAYVNLPLAARWAPLWASWPALADKPDDWLVRRFAEQKRFSATADGLSLAAFEEPCRMAAASARALLCKEAASRWGVAWEECSTENGFVIHGDQRARFGELADAAAERSPPEPTPLRQEAAQERPTMLDLGGKRAFPRLDLPAKVDGSYLFAGDVRLPDMVYAAIRHGPLAGAELAELDTKAVTTTPGLIGIVRSKRWVAAAARSWWDAEKALNALVPRFRVARPLDGAAIEAALDKAVRDPDTQRMASLGEGGDQLGDPTLALRYDVAPALHVTLETASATARFRDGMLELWLASQAPEQARRKVADAIGLSERDVVLYVMPAGGSFDRRLESDNALEAAMIAREIGRPVQLVWSRWEEQHATRPRTPVAAVLAARTDEAGNIGSWQARLALPATTLEFGARLFDNATDSAALEASAGRTDPMALEGALPPYAIANVALDHTPVDLGLPTGRMRGNAHGYTAFFTECFVDELAHRHDREPLSYRIGMLGNDPRLVACLQRAAQLAQWDGGADQSGQGLACHRMGSIEQGGRIAVIATAKRGEGGARVQRLSAAVDIGRIVNLDIARQQIEGGLVFGMGLALGAALSYENGLPTASRLGQMGLPLLADCPEIEIAFIDSDGEPFDPGELGMVAVAPAIANALFSATGLRLRRLPLLSDGL